MVDPATPRDRSADPLAAIAAASGLARTVDELMATAMPVVLSLAGARGCAVIRHVGQATVVVGAAGVQGLPLEELGDAGAGLIPRAALPDGWPEDRTVVLVPMHASHSEAVLVDMAGHGPSSAVETVLSIIDAGLARLVAEGELADLTHRVDNAQILANMGDYDWHIATDVNRWSDQLYRIYGHEPQSFNASYERFLSFIHPDDRDRIQGIHQQAYGTGGTYRMIERIVRPDGSVRFLSSNGEVVTAEDGTPVRMRGTCIDITPTVEAERAREMSTARFESLVESSPEAMLLVAEDGRVIQANSRTSVLLGSEPEGRAIDDVLGVAWDTLRSSDLGPTTSRMFETRGADGEIVPLDVTVARLSGQTVDGTDLVGDEARVAVFVSDARPRLASEKLSVTLREADLSRRQALEINDNVVQGITSGLYALDQGDGPAARAYLDRTLVAARRMMHDLLAPLDGKDLDPGDLIRAEPSGAERTPIPAEDGPRPSDLAATGPVAQRVLLVDDSADIRFLLEALLQTVEGFEVVGVARDGFEAVQQAGSLQPDLVLLDLAMPKMDGLQALPLVKAAAPAARVIVLSGFDQGMMAAKATEAGADGYMEKGHAMGDLATAIMRVLGPVTT